MLMCFVLVNVFVPHVALALDDGTFEYEKQDDGSFAIVDYLGSGGDVVIPSTYNDGEGAAPVTKIGALAFYYTTTLTSVTIPSNIKTIGSGAFSYCENLTDVTLAEGLTEIETSAFARSGITSVTIPTTLEFIRDEAFSECASLSSVTLPSGLTSIGPLMFYGCIALTSITIPTSVTTIGPRAFENCDSLSSVTLPIGLTVIGQEMFYSCDALESVTVPASVTSIGFAAFHSCVGLESVTLKNVMIGRQMFFDCDGLEAITIPEGITEIGEQAFRYCDGIETVTIPSSMEAVGEDAFANCSALQSVTVLGESTSFDEDVFYESIIQTEEGVMYGFEDSSAQSYASEYDINFVPICKFSFVLSDGMETSWDSTVLTEGMVSKPTSPTRTGYLFAGWYPTVGCDTTEVAFPYQVTQNTTLYAKWTASPINSAQIPQTGQNDTPWYGLLLFAIAGALTTYRAPRKMEAGSEE